MTKAERNSALIVFVVGLLLAANIALKNKADGYRDEALDAQSESVAAKIDLSSDNLASLVAISIVEQRVFAQMGVELALMLTNEQRRAATIGSWTNAHTESFIKMMTDANKRTFSDTDRLNKSKQRIESARASGGRWSFWADAALYAALVVNLLGFAPVWRIWRGGHVAPTIPKC